jgi:hypothetical protein
VADNGPSEILQNSLLSTSNHQKKKNFFHSYALRRFIEAKSLTATGIDYHIALIKKQP